ncbi:hypothetical protein D3C71_2117590 [compost metagenome]
MDKLPHFLYKAALGFIIAVPNINGKLNIARNNVGSPRQYLYFTYRGHRIWTRGVLCKLLQLQRQLAAG